MCAGGLVQLGVRSTGSTDSGIQRSTSSPTGVPRNSRRRDADDREDMAVERHATADNKRIGAEAAVPVRVAEHGDRFRGSGRSSDG